MCPSPKYQIGKLRQDRPRRVPEDVVKGTLSLPTILLGRCQNGTVGRVSKSASSGVWAVGEEDSPA